VHILQAKSEGYVALKTEDSIMELHRGDGEVAIAREVQPKSKIATSKASIHLQVPFHQQLPLDPANLLVDLAWNHPRGVQAHGQMALAKVLHHQHVWHPSRPVVTAAASFL
jgi:hypothetical protein